MTSETEETQRERVYECPYCAATVRQLPGGLASCGGCGYVDPELSDDPMVDELEPVPLRKELAMALLLPLVELFWRWRRGRR